MKKQFLAFDLGASSGRAILGTLENGKLSLQEVHRFSNGHKEIGNSLYWDFPNLVNELKLGLKKASQITKDISGIAIDTWGVDYVLFDKTTKDLKLLPHHYRDERTLKYCDEIWSKISQEDIYKRTGIQYCYFNTLYQLYADNKNNCEFLKNSTFLPMPDALAFMLGGDFTAEYTHATTSNLINPTTKNWDWELIDILDLPKDIFPNIVKSSTIGGCLSEALQNEYDLGAIPIIKVGSHDTASAVLATPAKSGEDFAYVSCGTWALLGAELEQVHIDLNAQDFTNEGGVGDKIRYLTNIMGCWLFQEIRRDIIANGKDITFSEMAEMALNSEKLKYIINPNNSAFALPNNMRQRIKDFVAKSLNLANINMSDAEVLRTVYDSLGLCFKEKLELLATSLNKNYKQLNIIGGGTQDKILMQTVADAINIKVVAGPIEATAIGNILTQAIAIGEIRDILQARACVCNSFEVIEYLPNQELRDKWNLSFEKFKKL